MMLLEYKEFKEPAERLKLDSETEAEWRKKDLKASPILVSTISDKQLEYVKDCTNVRDMINKFEKIYRGKWGMTGTLTLIYDYIEIYAI